MLRLSLVCSGIGEAMKRGAFPAFDDAVLEPRSIAMAGDLRKTLQAADKVLVASDPRARQTAELLGLSGEERDDLREQNYGQWAGKTLVEIETNEAAGLALWIADPDFTPPGGESLTAVAMRAQSLLAQLEKQSGHVIAVTHPAITRCAVLHVLAAPLSGFWQLDASPLCLTDLRHDGRRWALRRHGA